MMEEKRKASSLIYDFVGKAILSPNGKPEPLGNKVICDCGEEIKISQIDLPNGPPIQLSLKTLQHKRSSTHIRVALSEYGHGYWCEKPKCRDKRKRREESDAQRMAQLSPLGQSSSDIPRASMRQSQSRLFSNEKVNTRNSVSTINSNNDSSNNNNNNTNTITTTTNNNNNNNNNNGEDNTAIKEKESSGERVLKEQQLLELSDENFFLWYCLTAVQTPVIGVKIEEHRRLSEVQKKHGYVADRIFLGSNLVKWFCENNIYEKKGRKFAKNVNDAEGFCQYLQDLKYIIPVGGKASPFKFTNSNGAFYRFSMEAAQEITITPPAEIELIRRAQLTSSGIEMKTKKIRFKKIREVASGEDIFRWVRKRPGVWATDYGYSELVLQRIRSLTTRLRKMPDVVKSESGLQKNNSKSNNETISNEGSTGEQFKVGRKKMIGNSKALYFDPVSELKSNNSKLDKNVKLKGHEKTSASKEKAVSKEKEKDGRNMKRKGSIQDDIVCEQHTGDDFMIDGLISERLVYMVCQQLISEGYLVENGRDDEIQQSLKK